MNGKQYLKNQLPVIFINLLGLLILSLFLAACGNPAPVILFICAVWLSVMVFCLAVSGLARRKHLNRLLAMAEKLDERYLIPEILPRPERADDQVFYELMRMAEKSMLEKIGGVQQERREYKEYIEQWIHEVKTPITAMKLLCENNRMEFTRDILAELENVNRFTEQALYYARSEHTEKDYRIREVKLGDVVHDTIVENKYLLRKNNMKITVDDMDCSVFTDDKWVRFMLNQIISNAVKYRREQPSLHFFAAREGGWTTLCIEDNGIGIPGSDLPCIFDKGFTGQNGRTVHSSTGIGLYLCKRLCDKLGIGLDVFSGEGGTRVAFSFHTNDFVSGCKNFDKE